VLAQVEIAEREQELIKSIELLRQQMVKATYSAAQKVIELNNELAALEVGDTHTTAAIISLIKAFHFPSTAELSASQERDSQMGEDSGRCQRLYCRQREADHHAMRLHSALVSFAGETHR